jgi:DNA-binding MarR family transcriptional regulator
VIVVVAERIPENSGRAASPSRPAGDPGRPEMYLPDGLVDSLDKAFRRLRKSMVRPPTGKVPVPSLGRSLDVAKLFACDAVAELSETSTVVAVKDIAAELDLEHSTVSRLLGEIEDDGLVSRGVDPSDRRRTTVSLTPLGRAVVADATTMSRFITRVLLAEWPRPEVEELTRLLTRLAETVQSRLEVLPELAMAEFCRAHPESPLAQSRTTDELTPPRARRR